MVLRSGHPVRTKVWLPLRKSLPKWIASYMFVLHKARISRGFHLRKIYQLTKLEQRPWKLVNLRFRVPCDSRLSDLRTSTSQKMKKKQEKRLVSRWNTYPGVNFCNPHWEIISYNKWNQRTLVMSTPLEKATGINFHVQDGT